MFLYSTQGRCYHLRGPIRANSLAEANFCQVLFTSASDDTTPTEDMITARSVQATGLGTTRAFGLLPSALLTEMREVVKEYSPVYKMYKWGDEQLNDPALPPPAPNKSYRLVLCAKRDVVPVGEHERRYNVPVQQPENCEMSAVVTNENSEYATVCVQHRGGGLSLIKHHNPLLDALTYPVLFPFSDLGWTFNKYPHYKHQSPADHEAAAARVPWAGNKSVTQHEYLCYYIFERDEPTSTDITEDTHLCGGRITQQWIIDQHVRAEKSRLDFFRFNQDKIKACLYKEVQESLRTGEAAGGIHVVLPATHGGSPRDLKRQYQDSMAIIRRFGKPDLFVTFTCNPAWPEIVRNLKYGETAGDNPRLCARVFNAKLEAMKKDILENGVLGKVVAHVYVIEYQKRGLPHAHMLIILADQDKPRDADSYDRYVCAEIPADDGTVGMKRLRKLVLTSMIHSHRPGCYADDDPEHERGCKNNYPRPLCEATTDSEDGYPNYRRPPHAVDADPQKDAGIGEVRAGVYVTNADVVPYNPYLSSKYNAHINVEVVSSIDAVKCTSEK